MSNRHPGWWFSRIASVCLVGVTLSGAADDGARVGEWRRYSSDNASTKYSPLDQINRSNVAQLRIAWRRPQIAADFLQSHPTLRLSNNYRSTPIMVDGLLYATNAIGLAEAFDPATGRTVWTQRTSEDVSGNPGLGGALRGLALLAIGRRRRGSSPIRRTSSTRSTRRPASRSRHSAPAGASTSAICRASICGTRRRWSSAIWCSSAPSMPDQDSAAKKEGLPGEVRAFDVRTGKPRWTFPHDSARRRAGHRDRGRTNRGSSSARATSGRR